LGISFNSDAQKDSTSVQNVDEVRVSVSIKEISAIKIRYYDQRFFEKDIRELAAVDAGELLGRMAGANLKSYGGLGGLKTISVRSLGAGHSGVVVDGYSTQNSQTGQVDLSAIQSDNLIGAVISNGEQPNMMMPISSQVMGSSIILQSFENTFARSNDTLAIRANVRYGSFDHKNAYLGVKYNPKDWLISLFGKYRNAVGHYRYSYLNGNTREEGIRKNNDFEESQFGGSIGKLNERYNFRIGYRGRRADQGLPGAVVFYNSFADERLSTKDDRVFADLDLNIKSTRLRFYSSGNQQDIVYQDPDYLGQNGLESSFVNRNLQNGIQWQSNVSKRFMLRIGYESSLSDLTSNDTSFIKPTRAQNIGVLYGRVDTKPGQFYAQLSAQYLDENREGATEANDQQRLNPTVGFWSHYRFGRMTRHRVWYRNTFRMPSFNELYYNNVGNTELLPEDAHQINYGFEIVPFRSKGELYLRSEVYFNRVSNKIIAIPTKNLFVWSMQNVTNVNVYGGELMADYELRMPKNSSFKISGNYTFQKVIDVTPESITYGHQVAYTPMHMANLEFKFDWKQQGLRFSNNFTSSRYSLNENIEFNRLPAFFVSDLSLFKNFSTHRKNKLYLQFNIKNLFNQEYAYVRSFVMPGRNYLISVSYAFN
jgi:outer membrane cobalamin receptor